MKNYCFIQIVDYVNFNLAFQRQDKPKIQLESATLHNSVKWFKKLTYSLEGCAYV